MPRTPAPQVADAGFETSSAPRRVPSGPPLRRARCSCSVLSPRPCPAGPVAFPSAANGPRSHRVTTCVVTCDHDDDVIRVALSLSIPPPGSRGSRSRTRNSAKRTRASSPTTASSSACRSGPRASTPSTSRGSATTTGGSAWTSSSTRPRRRVVVVNLLHRVAGPPEPRSGLFSLVVSFLTPSRARPAFLSRVGRGTYRSPGGIAATDVNLTSM